MCSYPVRAGSTCVILTIGFLHNFAHAEKSAARPPEEPALTAEDRAHWAFRAPVRHAVAAVRAADWVRSPIDGFVLAALENANDHSALISKDLSVSTNSNATIATGNNFTTTANSQKTSGSKVSIAAKGKSTTGTGKAHAVKSENGENTTADGTTASEKSTEAKTKASVKVSAEAKAKSDIRSNVH